MPKEKILIIEDDPHISKLVQYNLDKAGYDCVVANSGEEALEVLHKKHANLIILDIMLPKMDGFEVCRNLKSNSSFKAIPVIILSAKGEEVDRIVGLELGADDYLVKPFSPRELVLRVKAILRRGQPEDVAKDVLTVKQLSVDISKHRVSLSGKIIELTPMEFKLLCLLITRRGRVQTRERLLADVWEIHADIDTRTIDTHIKRLREKLGKMGSYVETVRGLGYRFKEED